MTDHTPGRVRMNVGSIDLSPISARMAGVIRSMNTAFAGAAKTIGDALHQNPHSYHIHISTGDRYGLNPWRRALMWAEDDLWEAELLTDGAYRHRAVKAARDEIKRIRKVEIRERGWRR